ncbi:MAG: SPFH domain-containing protein [Candidatus Sericytochromatia bacterium]
MGLWEKITGEFIDIIQWLDSSQDTMVYRFERYGNEIKYGAKLIVRESQVAVFVNEGQIADVFNPGTYTLETKNMPIMTTLNSWKHGFESPFKAEVYFINMKTFTDCKWGTKNPIMLRDPEFGPVRLRAFGSYAIKISDPTTVVKSVSGTNGRFTIDQISDQLRNMIITRFTDLIGESKIPVLDLASNYNELSDFVTQKIKDDFLKYGFEIVNMLVENITLPEEVEKMLDKRSSMGIIGNLNAYTQFQSANAIEDAAKNPGGLAASGVGMGLGMNMANQMNNSFNQQNSFSSPPPLGASFYINLNGSQSGPYDNNSLQSMVKDGRLKRDTFVWKQGMAEWKKASEVAELNDLISSIPPSPPPLGDMPPPIPSSPKFHLNINGEQTESLDLNTISQMVKEGKVNQDTFAWKKGMSDWQKLSSIQELSSLFSNDEMPPPFKG